MVTSRIDPNFEQRKESLAKAARCTCYVGAKYSPDYDDCASATAFFVGPTTLLTAAHILLLEHDAPSDPVSIVAQLPGVRNAVIDVRHLFSENPTVETFVCKVLLEKPNFLVDIAILDCSHSNFRATEWLELDRTLLKHGITVDLVGYPGEYSTRHIVDSQRVGPLPRSAIQDIEELLPRSALTVSHGPVTRGGNLPTYRVSTMGGMSGSPVIVQGKAVGTIPPSNIRLILRGVHIGCSAVVKNRCVPFHNDSAWKILKDNAVVGEIDLEFTFANSKLRPR